MDLEFIGHLGDGIHRRAFRLRVHGPNFNRPGPDYFIELEAPTLFSGTERIFGVDPDQARQLAVRYVTAHLNGRVVYDREGHPVDLEELFQTET